MKLLNRAVVTAVVTVAAALVAMPAASAANQTTIRAGQAVADGGMDLSATRSKGHVDFLRNGLHVWTEDWSSESRAAGYFPLTDQTWPTSARITLEDAVGTIPPGVHLQFTLPGATGSSMLVYEPKYYGENWWLTPGSTDEAKALAPHVGGGYGSQWYGTLAEWKAKLDEAGKAPSNLLGGFSLGSGVLGDYVITRIRFDNDIYEFTNIADDQGPKGDAGEKGDPGVAPGTVEASAVGHFGFVKRGKKNRKQKVVLVLTTDQGTAGTVVGKKVKWVIRVDGRVVSRLSQGFADRDRVVTRFARRTGTHLMTLSQNGRVVKTIKVKTGKRKAVVEPAVKPVA